MTTKGNEGLDTIATSSDKASRLRTNYCISERLLTKLAHADGACKAEHARLSSKLLAEELNASVDSMLGMFRGSRAARRTSLMKLCD